MELNERETLVRLEQQLKDSLKNTGQIMSDLKEIFQRIEKESKVTTTTKAEIATHCETSSLRFSEINKSLDELDDEVKKVMDLVQREKEDRIKQANEENKAREIFEEEVRSSVRTMKWIMGLFVSLVTVATFVFQLLKYINK